MKPHRFFIVAKFLFFVKEKRIYILSGLGAFLIFALGFSLGFIKGGYIIHRPPMIIDQELIIDTKTTNITSLKAQEQYVASSKGKYYYPLDCSLAQNLSEKNKIYFSNQEEAESRGYIKNSRCEY